MANTETFAIVTADTATEANRNRKERREAMRKKIHAFGDKLLDCMAILFEIPFVIGLYLGRVFENILNLAVKLSIIVIALLMIQNFAKSNPAEWATCTTSIVEFFNNCVETFNSFFGMFFLFN